MTIFKLPDLGEGLAEAEIVEWLVKPGDHVKTDQHLVSVETAKAVVEIPAPFHGVIKKLHGNAGDVIPVGNALIEFESDADTGSVTVAGKLEIGNTTIAETARIAKPTAMQATPAIRALAKQLQVNLGQVTGTGHQGAITREDVQNAAKQRSTQTATNTTEKALHGTRRVMAQVMSKAHAQVVPVSIYDEANISAWLPKTDITARMIRAIVKACKAEPTVNAGFNGEAQQMNAHVNLGLAIDTKEGLFAPVLREIDKIVEQPKLLREQIDHFKKAVTDRTISPADMQGATITLSNFGIFAGRFATAIIVPPQVAILATGKIRDAVLPINNEPKVQRIIPLSLTVDHRSVTGGEAIRFLGVLIADLELPI